MLLYPCVFELASHHFRIQLPIAVTVFGAHSHVPAHIKELLRLYHIGSENYGLTNQFNLSLSALM